MEEELPAVSFGGSLGDLSGLHQLLIPLVHGVGLLRFGSCLFTAPHKLSHLARNPVSQAHVARSAPQAFPA